MKNAFLIFCIALLTQSCDPALTGNLVVYNNSSDTLLLNYEIGNGVSDTEKMSILPGEAKEIYALGGIGDKRAFNCCPCVVSFYSLRSSNGNVKKDIRSGSNWGIPNKDKLKTYGSEPVRCSFTVNDSDL